MTKLALLGVLGLAACAQPQFQTAGVPPDIAARCKLLAHMQPDQTFYTNSITGSLLLSAAVNGSKQQQIFVDCVEAAEAIKTADAPSKK